MGSIPARFSGLGSAINNSISRVGQPLLGAFIFIAVSATFYATLARARADARHVVGGGAGARSSRSTRRRAGATPEQVSAADTQASMDAFHLAMRVSAVLLVIGAPRRSVRAPRAAGAPRAEAGDPVDAAVGAVG